MATCRACSSEITGTDRYCRNCGVPVAPTVAEFDDTRRFNPSATLPAAPPGLPDPTNPLYAPPSAAYAAPQASPPLRKTGLMAKFLLIPNVVWVLIAAALFVFFSLGIGIGAMSRRRPPYYREQAEARQAQNEMNDEIARREYEIAVQNALGFKQGVYSATEFPGVQGIFINNLMSDDSPAALAKIQAGDLLTKLNNQQTRNDSELSEVLKSLETGQEVPAEVYRDGATVSSRIKIADRAFPPPQPKTEPRDQGFLGILDSFRRTIPGTKKWGVEVRELHINGPAELFGLLPGDIITEFNGHPVKTPNEFNRHIRASRPRGKVSVTLYRGNTEQKVEVIIGHRWDDIE
ncbi:MAG TPA: PDZ domain-containing protein [Blastocatellia bacterium]|nr:PDZ domain-containing protein [Blastocatellia bacterium]